MTRIDLRTLALRLKVIEMLRVHAWRQQMATAPQRWRRSVHPN